jgi:hypothetical protein
MNKKPANGGRPTEGIRFFWFVQDFYPLGLKWVSVYLKAVWAAWHDVHS